MKYTKHLMRSNSFIRNNIIYKFFSQCKGYLSWGRRGFAAPSPSHVKHGVLLRNGFREATWIETGTFQGRTTEILARQGLFVYSIEPQSTLFRNASQYFESCPNVKIIMGLSEDVLPKLLPELSGKVNFWLDGHFSDGKTHKGPKDTPIIEELKTISDNIHRFDNICVMVDDVRLFSAQVDVLNYPPLRFLVDWAEANHLVWHIEHDIFIAKS